MINFMKLNKLTFLKCEKCSETRKSALGIISHQQMCGLTPEQMQDNKVLCEKCNSRVLPVSFNSHITRFCRSLKPTVIQETSDDDKEEISEQPQEFSQSGRAKRKSVKKAEKSIKRIVDDSKTMCVEDVSVEIHLILRKDVSFFIYF